MIFEDRELPGVLAIGRRVRILDDLEHPHMEDRTGTILGNREGDDVRKDPEGNVAIQVDGLYTVYYPPEDLEVL